MASQKKRPTGQELSGMLVEGHFGNQGGEPLPLADPVTVTQLVINLSQIKPYDRNPRQVRNDEYDEIKESILNTKRLNNEISVTRRPGDDHYMVSAGGNTRLQILNELYQDTGDDAFYVLNCLFKPWISELHILTAHLIENGLRAPMVLIDKAYATLEMKKELEAEQGSELSRDEFSKLATANGYRLSRRNITRFNYAIELDQMIPQLLRSGLGSDRIDQIKKMHRAYKDYCSDKTDQFELLLVDVMSKHDDEEFDLKDIRTELDEQLEQIIGVRHNLIYMEIQSILINAPSDHDLEPFPESGSTPVATMNQQQNPEKPDTLDSQQGHTSQELSTALANSENPLPDHHDSITPSPLISENTSSSQTKNTDDLMSFRTRNYELACMIAKPFDLEKIIIAVNNGLGFIIECLDYPFDIHDPSAADGLKCQYLVWWLLFSMSEQNVTDSHYSAWMHTELFRLYHESDTAETDIITQRINDAPAIGILFTVLMQNAEILSDKTFTECFRLMENIRKTRTNFPDEALWLKNNKP
jgi:ParB family protein of integrating conjugative element (PFGI_1 class)